MSKKKAGRKKASAKRGASPKRRATPRRSLAKSIAAKEDAIRELGRERIRPGPILIGSTGWLTPTRQGFRALDGALLAIQRASKKKDRAAFTFDLMIRARGPSGKIEPLPPITGAGFPRSQEVSRRRRKGETEAQAYRRIVEVEIKKAIFRAADQSKDVRGNSDELKRKIAGKKPDQVRKAIQRFKSERSLTFKVRVNRIVT